MVDHITDDIIQYFILFLTVSYIFIIIGRGREEVRSRKDVVYIVEQDLNLFMFL